jgi:LacI family transcriptional regulator
VTTVWPELTTVRQPVAAMAEAAIELLVAGRKADRSVLRNETERVLGHELILRDSTAPPGSESRLQKRPRRLASAPAD